MTETMKPSWEDDARIDQLVDGELSEQEYRDLLRTFDRHPEGWRRCALAFLEAQAWQRELGSLRSERLSDGAAAAVQLPQRRRGLRWGALLAMAASFLLAFALGVAYRARWAPSPTDGMPVVQQGAPAALPGDVREPNVAEPVPPTQPYPAGRPRGYVLLAADREDGSAGEELEVPLYDWSPENAWMLQGDLMAIPPELERALENMGREVHWDRTLVPVEMDDGHRALVPMRRLEITPVNDRRYQ